MASLYVFHQGGGDSGELWYSFLDEGGPNPTKDVRIPIVGMSESPSAVVYQNYSVSPPSPVLFVFFQGLGETGQLAYTYSSDGVNWYEEKVWAAPDPGENLVLSGSPSTVVYNGLLYVFHQGGGDNGQLWYSVFDGVKWSADTQIHNVGMSDSPSAVAWQGGITVFHQGSGENGGLWYTYSPDGTNWGPDTQVPGVGMSVAPSAVVYNGLLYVFHQGSYRNGQLWYSFFNGTYWSAERQIQPNVALSESPSAVLWQGGIPVLHQGSYENGGLWYTYSPDGGNWSGDTPWGGDTPVHLVMSGSPGCVVF